MYLWGIILLTPITLIVLSVRRVWKRSGRLPTVTAKGRVVGLVVLHAGVLLVLWATYDLRGAAEVGGWPHVTGRIIETEIEAGRNYRPEITYRYIVDGAEYTRVSHLHAPGFGGKYKKYDAAKGLLEQYRVGDSIDIRYNPNRPGESTLTPQPAWDVYVKLATGVLIFAVGLMAALLPRRVR